MKSACLADTARVGEYTLHYQPTVDLHTGEIEGVEALGALVLEQVARQAREWESQGMRLDIAFNLSPRQLSEPELLERMLSAAGVPSERFFVEIAESSVLSDFESAIALLREIRAHGFRIALDDFRGELSLSQLLELPVDIFKIDRSLIAALSTAPKAAVMVQMIIQLADKLGVRAHAEGVESEAEHRFLLANGCDHGQGDLFSTPVPARAIRQLYLESIHSQILPLHADHRRELV